MREQMRNQAFIHLRDGLGLPEAICANLVETAGQNLKQAYDEALAALAMADFAEAVRIGHRMKGNMLNAGLNEGAKLALEFEKASGGRIGGEDHPVNPPEAGRLLEQLGALLFD